MFNLNDIANVAGDAIMSGTNSSNDSQVGSDMIFKEYVFIDECQVPDEIFDYLVDGEKPVAAYKTFRDAAVFTNKRLIIIDRQGMTGKKVERLNIPYKEINAWSSENAGRFDLDSEITIYSKVFAIKLNLRKDVDMPRLERLITNIVMR